MAKTKQFGLDNPAPVIQEEDGETLAAIDEGIRDAEAGRTATLQQVRKLLVQTIPRPQTSA